MLFLAPDLKKQLEATVEKFLSERYGFEQRQEIVASDTGYCANNWQQFAELGWLSVPFEEQYGGANGNVFDTIDMLKMFGRALVVEPFISTLGLVGTAIQASDNQHWKEALIPQFISGEKIGALAFEEMGSRGNPACIRTTAVPEGNGYRLQGKKIAVLNAPQADVLLVSARTSGELTDRTGISLFLIPLDQAGITLEAYTTVDGHRAANIEFDLQVSEEALLTDAGEGYPVLSRAIEHGMLMLSAEAIGIMQMLLDTTVEYTNTRHQFKVPLSTFQVLRHSMADMFVELHRADALLENLAEQLSAGNGYSETQLRILKAQVARSGRTVGASAIQLHGGMGMTDELIVGHAVKRLATISQLLGNADFHLKQLWSSSNVSKVHD